jgi:hypothetical protein
VSLDISDNLIFSVGHFCVSLLLTLGGRERGSRLSFGVPWGIAVQSKLG